MCILVLALKKLHHKSMMSEAQKLTGKKKFYQNLRITWWIDKNMRGTRISFTNLIFQLQF